jgi:hypothetical protein
MSTIDQFDSSGVPSSAPYSSLPGEGQPNTANAGVFDPLGLYSSSNQRPAFTSTVDSAQQNQFLMSMQGSRGGVGRSGSEVSRGSPRSSKVKASAMAADASLDGSFDPDDKAPKESWLFLALIVAIGVSNYWQ